MTAATPEVHTGVSALNSVINPVVSDAFAPEGLVSINPLQLWIPLAATLWLAGIGAMLVYTAVSYLLLRRRVATAVLLENNIYRSENVDSPFVLGIFRPKIYLPFQMDGESLTYVIAHEQAHIRRGDHLWKPFGFLLLALHWFNPLMWLGYILLCRDIELACDEKVIKAMDNEAKANYTQALVTCSVNRRSIAACPLAFGEVGVKERVKSVMNYKKPAFWIVAAAIAVCVIVGACFLTNPVTHTLENIEDHHFDARTYEHTAAMVSDGETNTYVGVVDRELLQELYSIRISRKALSQSRSEDREKSNTLILNLPHREEPEILTSFVGGTFIHFNGDFTEVWVDDRVKPTLSYKVLDAEKARNIYYRIKGSDSGETVPVETVKGNLKTYYKNADGTWQVEGRDYKYRLEITGRMHNAAGDSTFVYLSNLETIPFDRAWKAAGFSSNSEDYFAPEEAVLVEWHQSGSTEGEKLVARSGEYSAVLLSYTSNTPRELYAGTVNWLTIDDDDEAIAPFRVWEGEKERFGVYTVFDAQTYEVLDFFRPSGLAPQTYLFQNADPQRQYIVLVRFDNGDKLYAFGVSFEKTIVSESVQSAVTEAILERNSGDRFPAGQIPVEAHCILGVESRSGTPLEGQTNAIQETTVYVQYVYNRYSYSGGKLESVGGIATPARLTFSGNREKGYVLEEFLEPKGGDIYAEEIRKYFPEDIAAILLDPQSDIVDTEELESQCLSQAEAYFSELSGYADLKDAYEKDGPLALCTITKNDDSSQSYKILDKNGKLLYSQEHFWRYAEINQVGSKVLEFSTQAGTGISTRWAVYCDVENSRVSETFYYVLMVHENYVVYGDYKNGEHSVVVQDLFDKSAYYKEYTLTNCSPVAADVILKAETNGEGSVVVTYPTGDDYKVTELTINLP